MHSSPHSILHTPPCRELHIRLSNEKLPCLLVCCSLPAARGCPASALLEGRRISRVWPAVSSRQPQRDKVFGTQAHQNPRMFNQLSFCIL